MADEIATSGHTHGRKLVGDGRKRKAPASDKTKQPSRPKETTGGFSDLFSVFDGKYKVYAKRAIASPLPIAVGDRPRLLQNLQNLIVEVHGARAWADSEDQGPGCTFCFALPRKDVADANTRKARQEDQQRVSPTGA